MSAINNIWKWVFKAKLVAFTVCLRTFIAKRNLNYQAFVKFRSCVNQSTKQMRKKWINSVIFASKQFTNDFNYYLRWNRN
ncbi:hypothetical protein HYD63_00885 [Mycoplasmopsis bovis]|nr:hypothetical protein [Mycoplasmopsis bovis]QQH60330.1 hypothetical protein HYD63_00885 [Mycoplasmopsis bovis]